MLCYVIYVSQVFQDLPIILRNKAITEMERQIDQVVNAILKSLEPY